MVTFVVLGSILPLTVFGLVEIFHNLGAGGYGFLVVGIDVVDENSQRLSSEPEP